MTIGLVALWTLNCGYLFEDTFQPLNTFSFFSSAMSGQTQNSIGAGNRFADSWLGQIPVPVPRNMLQGIDWVKFEYERGYPSYLRGVKRDGGWWYYYLYAMLVKMPVGTQTLLWTSLFLLSRSAWRILQRRLSDFQLFSDELYLLAPAVCVLVLVSSQTGFNHHLRYVLPAFPFLFIFASGAIRLTKCGNNRGVRAIPTLCVLATITSSLATYPHSLSYFNEPCGASINGWKHLDFSNLDWGQDLLLAKEWVEAHPEAKPLYFGSSGLVSPTCFGIACQDLSSSLVRTSELQSEAQLNTSEFRPGWYIMGLSHLVDPQLPVHKFLERKPEDYIGYSMRVYHVSARNTQAAEDF